jgi:hypothetical protein
MSDISSHRWMKHLIDRSVEVIIVFIGVYAAFVLNAHQIHKQDQQRRHQILIYLEKQATTSTEKLRQVTLRYDERMNAFLTQLVKGEMQGIRALSGYFERGFQSSA